MNDPTPSPESTESDFQPESEGQATPGAQGPLVERLRQAVKSVYDRHDDLRPLNHVNVVEWVEAVEPVVAAEVEAAVSVVRSEMAGKVDRARHSARRAGLRAKSAETERDEARAEVERLKRKSTLGAWRLANDRAEAAEAERDALREKVAKVEALIHATYAAGPPEGGTTVGGLLLDLRVDLDPHEETQCRYERCGGSPLDPCVVAFELLRVAQHGKGRS